MFFYRCKKSAVRFWREDRSWTWMEKRTIREILRADMRLAKGQQVRLHFQLLTCYWAALKEAPQITDILRGRQNFCSVIMLSFYALETPDIMWISIWEFKCSFSVLTKVHEGARGTYNIESEIQRNNEEQTRGLSVDFLFQNSPTRWLLDYLEMRSPQRALGLETEDLSVQV